MGHGNSDDDEAGSSYETVTDEDDEQQEVHPSSQPPRSPSADGAVALFGPAPPGQTASSNAGDTAQHPPPQQQQQRSKQQLPPPAVPDSEEQALQALKALRMALQTSEMTDGEPGLQQTAVPAMPNSVASRAPAVDIQAEATSDGVGRGQPEAPCVEAVDTASTTPASAEPARIELAGTVGVADVAGWLSGGKLERYTDAVIAAGYDDLSFLSGMEADEVIHER